MLSLHATILLRVSIDTSSFYILNLFLFIFFFFNDTATTEIYTLSLHDALPIWKQKTLKLGYSYSKLVKSTFSTDIVTEHPDRKSTRLNSSHSQISYAVFCLKKKKNKK